MARPKASGDAAATPELCVNCGMPPCNVDPTLPITLLFSKATRQVLCLEAGKDFVDTLMGFLTLPVGCIVKLLEQASMIHRPECKLAPQPSAPLVFPPDCSYTPVPKKGKNCSGEHFALSSISNIFESVVRLDDKEMSTDKSCLVDPKPAIPFGAGKMLDLHNSPGATTENSTESVDVANCYSCGNACSFYSTSPATKCPKHKKKMSVPLKFVEGSVASGSDGTDQGGENSQDPKGGGYVKEGTKYMVTNTLEIFTSAEAIKALIALNISRCERVGDLDTMPVSVVTAEFFKRSPKLSFLSAWKTLAANVLVWGLLWHPRVYPYNNAEFQSNIRLNSESRLLCHVRDSKQQLETKVFLGDQR